MTIQGVSSEIFETMRKLVTAANPDPRCAPTDALVASVICSLPPEVREVLGVADTLTHAAAGLFDAAQNAALHTEDAAAHEVSYLRAIATHERFGKGAHRFTAELPCVRFRLPADGEVRIATNFGIVFSGDSKLWNAAHVKEKYDEVFDFEVAKVYLTTPPRYLGARFAAIAIYEVWDTARVRAWILEAGMATGEPMVIFCSPAGNRIARRAWYQPTPFAAESNWYTGDVEFYSRGVPSMTGGQEGPASLEVTVCTAEEFPKPVLVRQAYVHVHVAYAPVRADLATPTFPSKLTAEAALRVAAIAVAKGSSDPIFNLLAPFGRALAWERAPG